MLRRFVASGQSMAPAFPDGASLLVIRWPQRWLRSGQVVVYQTQHDGFIVKRVDRVQPDGLVLSSDNAATHSIYCGQLLPLAGLVGRVFYSW